MGDSEFGNKTELEQTENETEDLSLKDFIAEIKRLRAKTGMSQRKLSFLLGVEQPIIVRIEAGNYGITLDLVQRLAHVFNDNPHRLADIFWGIKPSNYEDPNKILLDEMWDLMAKHYHLLPLDPPLPPHKPRYSSPKLKGKTPKADKLSDERDQSEQDQGQDLPTENISETPDTETETGED